MTTTPFLPLPADLSIEQVTTTDDGVQVSIRATSEIARCPLCDTASNRVRSTYERTVADVPCGGQRVTLHLHMRRFGCRTPTCPRRIFAEQFPDWLLPRARHTQRHRHAVVMLGLATSGSQAARVARALAMPTSPATINRTIMRLVPPPSSVPLQVGIDDFAFHRGHRYGTIVVDLARHQVLDLLADREATTVAAWLRMHPSVAWVSRDRGGAYADGVRQSGLPIEQVADRWHLLANLGDAIERIAGRGRWGALGGEAQQRANQHAPQVDSGRTLPLSLPQQERRRAILQLHQGGDSQRQIARKLQLAPGTVRRYIHGYTTQLPRVARPSLLDAFRARIYERWQAGKDAMQIYHEIREQSFRGKPSIVRRLVTKWRQEEPPLAMVMTRSARQVRWLLVRPSTHLTQAEQAQRLTLLAMISEASTVFSLYHRFWGMLRHQDVTQLVPWLRDAQASGMQELRTFAAGIERDIAAVSNGIASPLSQGQTEGQITKLKLIKRQMYGRAGLSLLRQRLLHPV